MDSYQYAVEVVGQKDAPRGCGGLWPTKETRITSPFGMRVHPVSGVKKNHNGIDIGTEHRQGLFVIAPVSGTIQHSESKGGGMQIGIRTKDRLYSFCHLSKRLVPHGAKVRVGQLIALTGNTGASSGPHLHFGIWDTSGKTATPIDPMSHWWIRLVNFTGFEGNS